MRNLTRAVKIGSVTIGNNNPIAVQTMASTRTNNTKELIEQIKTFENVGADIARIAIDSKADVEALKVIRENTTMNLAVDIQENYRLIEPIAKSVDKVRYNPGHLWHHEPKKSWQDKVQFIAETAGKNNCALRVGINCGSVDPSLMEKYNQNPTAAMLESAFSHCSLLDKIGFKQYCVSLKDSDPNKVIKLNIKFAKQRPDIPLHLGVTEAGLPSYGIIKTRIALEQLISRGIGDTIRVSLTLPNDRKYEEIIVGKRILDDIVNKRVISDVRYDRDGLNLISCPSCSRVENEKFIELTGEVEKLTRYANDLIKGYAVTIAIMGCRVNGPGETMNADLGLWCGPKNVNLMRASRRIGAYSYDTILPVLEIELDKIISEKR